MALGINVNKDLGNGDTLNKLFMDNGTGVAIVTDQKRSDLVNVLDVSSIDEYLEDPKGRSQYYKGIIDQFHTGEGNIENIIEEVEL